eukprot:5718652-Prymnesium_polylepis.1
MGFPISNATAEDSSAYPEDKCLAQTPPDEVGPSDGIKKPMDGLWIGGWPFWGLYHRGTVDEVSSEHSPQLPNEWKLRAPVARRILVSSLERLTHAR